MSSWIRRSCGSLAETIASEYFCTNSVLGENMRAPTNSSPVRVINRARMPPVRDFERVYGVMMTYASCCDIVYSGRRIRRRGRRRRRRGGCGRRLAAENLEHDGAARRALSLDRLPPVFHDFFNGVDDLFFGFALYAISFGHRQFPPQSPHAMGQLVGLPYGRLNRSVNWEKPGKPRLHP